jgi:hypothetical protein
VIVGLNSGSYSPECVEWSGIKAPVGSFISALAIAPGDSETVWVGHVNGEVYRSANATHEAPSWQLIGEAGQKPLPRGR